MKNLIFSFLIVFSTSLANDYFTEKELDVTKTQKITTELPCEKVRALIKIKKDIIADEIHFRNRFNRLRSLSNEALKDNNETRYKVLIREIALLKDEMELMRFYRLQEIENIVGTRVPKFYNDETVFEYFNIL